MAKKTTGIKKRGPIDFIKDLTERKTPWASLSETDQKAFSPFLMNMWLGMNHEYVEIVNELQRYTMADRPEGRLSAKNVYKLYLDYLPKVRLPFSKFVKRTVNTKYNPDLLKIVSKHFHVSELVAEEYVDMIPKDRMEEIVRLYPYTDKEVKKLLK